MIQIVTITGLESDEPERTVRRLLEKIRGVTHVTDTTALGVYQVESRQMLSPDELDPTFAGTKYTVSSIV